MPTRRTAPSRTQVLTLLFAGFVAAASVPPAGADTPANTETAGSILTIRGTAVLPDGTIARDALLEPMQSEGEAPSFKIVDGEFEIRTTGTVVNAPSLRCRTPDGRFQTSLIMHGHSLRSMTRSPLRLLLEPARIVRLNVTDQGMPAAHARVLVRTDSGNSFGTTGSEGLAEVMVPARQSIFAVGAWTDEKMGGLNTYLRRANHEEGLSFAIELFRTTPVRARAVDARRQPLAGVPLTLSVHVERTSQGGLWGIPSLSGKTDAQGEVVLPAPDWPNRQVSVSPAYQSPWRSIDEKALPDGSFELTVAPSRTKDRIAIEGTVAGGTSENAGLLVELWSYQGEEEDSMDFLQARTDAEGRFRANVLPGSDYFVVVDDRDLVSTTWTGVPALASESVRQSPKLELIPATAVEIVATQGPDRKPVRDAWLHFETQHQKNHSRRFWAKTDQSGRSRVSVAPGDLDIRVTAGEWKFEKRVQVTDGVPLEVPLHREVAERQMVRGRLTLPEGTDADLSGTTVSLRGIDGESHDSATATADRDGRFTASIAARRISLVAVAPMDRWTATTIFDVGADPVEIPMLPTMPFEGRVLEADERPAVGMRVVLRGRLTDRGREAGFRSDRAVVDAFAQRETTTDAEGRFTFPRTPQRTELTIIVDQPGKTVASLWEERWLEPGEIRPAEVFHLPAKSPPARRPPEITLPMVIRDARLSGLHTLVAITGQGEAPQAFLKRFLDGDNVEDIYSFYPKEISGPEAARSSESQAFLTARNWPLPDAGTVFLAILDEDGKELGRLSLEPRDDLEAIGQGIEFLRRHLPPKLDAREGYDAALAEAKRTGRRIWARVGGSRCGPCFLLSRWIDDHREVLEKDYVLFRFDGALDRHGSELSQSLKFSEHGIPCHAILDAGGTPLATSIGPLGNIGFPGGTHEAASHLRKMLITTSRTLSKEEIDSLIETLTAK